MKEIEIIEIPLSDAPPLDKMCVEHRDERYFIAYETNNYKRHSVLFLDLAWIRKHFGVDRTESSVITHDSLNDGRRNEISRYELAISLNVRMWELNNWNFEKGKWKTIKERNDDRGTDNMIHKLPTPDALSETGKVVFQKNIDLGLLVLCKYV